MSFPRASAPIEADIHEACDNGPHIVLVNSDQGSTTLHVPSDVIINASIPPMIRDSGHMWNLDGGLRPSTGSGTAPHVVGYG